MAIENKYVDADVAADKLTTAALIEGAKTVALSFTFEVAVADDDNSVYRIMKAVNSQLIPLRIEVYNDAISGGTDYDLGFYETTEAGVLGQVIDQDALAATLDMSSGATRGSPKDGLKSVDISNIRQRLFEIAGQTQATRKLAYDIAFTAVTVGAAAGTISGVIWFVQG